MLNYLCHEALTLKAHWPHPAELPAFPCQGIGLMLPSLHCEISHAPIKKCPASASGIAADTATCRMRHHVPHHQFTNSPITEVKPVDFTQMASGRKGQRSSEMGLAVAFSGGGTRAAAFSYGVLEKLRDTWLVINGEETRLLDEIDVISSVSGGSFTAAYYGLYGDRMIEDQEEAFAGVTT